MTTKPPPTYFFNGITYNSAYYTIVDEGGSLTQSQAGSRYLIKTQNDTTNNLQTFSAGLNFSGILNGPSIVCSLIKTENVQSTSNSIPLLIGNNQLGNSGRIDIGCNVARTGSINIANTQTTGTASIVIGSNALTTGTQNITVNRPLTIGWTTSELNNTFNRLGGYFDATSVEAIVQSPGISPIHVYSLAHYMYATTQL